MEDHPRFAGQAFWARILRRRVDRPYKVLESTKHMLTIGSGKETKAAYEQLVAALDEFVRKTFNDWAIMVDRQSFKRLECPLMVRSQVQRNLLDINFDHYLLKLFAEINYWEILMFEIPHYAADVYQRREELRNLREHVMLVVRDYNRVITELKEDEIGIVLDFQFKITNGPEEHISRTSEKLTKRTFQGANQSPGQKGPTRFDQTELESEFIF